MWEAALRTFLVIFLAEMGDKSQFLMLALSAEYRLRDIIAGVSGAVCVLNLLAIGVGTALGSLLPLPLISVVAGLAFLSFALTGLRREEGGFSLAYPFRPSEPFPLVPLFCFAPVEELAGEPCLIFPFRPGGCPRAE